MKSVCVVYPFSVQYPGRNGIRVAAFWPALEGFTEEASLILRTTGGAGVAGCTVVKRVVMFCVLAQEPSCFNCSG